MKTIGLIGGMSWESTISYYRIINETVKKKLGGFHSAKIILYSVNFHEIERMLQSGDWIAAGKLLVQAGNSLMAGGADFLILCTNTMHRIAEMIENEVGIPLYHIADATAKEINQAGLTRIGLLGTRFTMEQDFFKDRLLHQHGIEIIIPDEKSRESIHRIIFEELCQGIILEKSRSIYRDIINKLIDKQVQGIILGCTEIPMLINKEDSSVPLFDTTAIHACAAAEVSLDNH